MAEQIPTSQESQMSAFKDAYRESQGPGYQIGPSYSTGSNSQMENFKSAYRDSESGAADPQTPASDQSLQTVSGSGVQQTLTTPASADNTPGTLGEAPPKADAAPKTAETAVSGLCDALNKHQKDLVKQGVYEVADVYAIVFSPPSMGAAKMTKPGPTENSRTAMQNNSSAKQKVDPKTNSVQKNTMTMNIAAGTQIIQFIDQVMKNSSYISDQQTIIIDKDGKETPNPDNTGGQTAWYNVALSATPIKYDNKRRDFAYKLTYTVTPYAINNMQSQYFPKSGFRGLHKSYKYWFTGQNTEVLNFEQDYNYLYRLIMSGNAPDPKLQTSDSREVTRRIYQTNSEQSMQGGNNKSTEPAANAADYLYSPSDQSKIKLKIIGDPAWIEQGDISLSSSGNTGVNLQPFLPDGTININGQQVCFDISWNKPEDYDLETGLVPVTSKNINGQAQIDTTYTAVKCRSTFSHGRFEQDLEGVLLIEYFDNNKNNVGAISPENAETDGRTTESSPSDSGPESSTGGTGAAPAVSDSGPAEPVSSNGQNVAATNDAMAERLQQIGASNSNSAPTPAPSQDSQMANFKSAYRDYQATQPMALDT